MPGRFFETEGIAVLVLMVLKYRITVTEEAQFEHETLEEKRERIFDSISGITLT